MQKYLDLKEKHISRLKAEINLLSELDKYSAVEISIEGMNMSIDHEVLLREKKNELESVNMFFNRLLELNYETVENEKSIQILKEEKVHEVEMYLKGIKFTFNREELLKEYEERKIRLLKEEKEICDYFETGKQPY